MLEQKGEGREETQWKNKSLTCSKIHRALSNIEHQCCFIIKPPRCCYHGNKATNIWSYVTPSTKIPDKNILESASVNQTAPVH